MPPAKASLALDHVNSGMGCYCYVIYMHILDVRDHWARYWDIFPSFCQISYTFDQREIILSHNILKYLPQEIYWWIFN